MYTIDVDAITSPRSAISWLAKNCTYLHIRWTIARYKKNCMKTILLSKFIVGDTTPYEYDRIA